MNRFEVEPLVPQSGVRTAASGTERILIGLATMALLGGVVLGVANLLHVDFEALASWSPQPSVEASSTQRPTPEPRARDQFVLELIPSPLPEPEAGSSTAFWIKARADLPVHGSPSLDTAVWNTLLVGEAALVSAEDGTGAPEDGAGWLHLMDPYGGGWVATVVDGEDLVTRYPYEESVSTGWISRVVAGRERFLALGWSPVMGEAVRTTLFTSTDGATWSWAGQDLAAYGDVMAISEGPAGWLATVSIGSGWFSRGTSLQRSADGLQWEPLGMLPQALSSGWELEMLGSSFGYLLFQPNGYGRAWFSQDGTAWREMDDLPHIPGQGVGMAGVADGFLAWSFGQGGTGGTRTVSSFSVDGRTWQLVQGGPTSDEPWRPPLAVEFGQQVVGLGWAGGGGAVAVWLGAIDDGRLTWRRVPGADAAFAGATVTAMGTDGSRAVAFGFERGSWDPLTWVGDGVTWSRQHLPARIGSLGSADAGPIGAVIVDLRPNLAGENPIFWHLAADGTYQPEASPLIPVAPERPADCGSPPRDLLELQARSAVSLVSCFGAARYTIRGWAVECPWCADEPDPAAQRYDEAWLAMPPDRLGLAPQPNLDTTLLDGVFDIDLDLGSSKAWAERWVEVTLHLDDPRATRCDYHPVAGEYWYTGSHWLVSQCRLTWVIDAVREVNGP